MHLDTISGRIFATLAGLVVVLLVAASIFGQVMIRDFHRREVETRLDTAARLLIDPATDVLAGRRDRAAFNEHLRALGGELHLRLTVIEPDGTVIADSESPLPLGNHSDREELRQAAERGRGFAARNSATTALPTQYVAWRVEEGGRTLGFARAAAELPEVQASIHTLHTSLLVGAVCACIVGLAASALLARRLAGPLEEIGRGAAAVTAGGGTSKIAARGPREIQKLAGSLNAMAAELERRVEITRRARAEIETILASMAEGVVAVDEHERLLFMNRAGARLLGLGEPLPSGTVLWERLRFPELERALRSALVDGTTSQLDATSPRRDGRVLAISAAPVGGERAQEDAALGGAVALLSDVTAIRRLEKVRIDFVANVSHELRTPLSAVLGALETLSDPREDDATRERFVELARRNADRLQAIVSDLLDLSSIEAEGDSMLLEPTRIELPIKAAASALAGAARSKGVELSLANVAHSEALVAGNAQRLEQVFTNLLENAIKYTPAGGRIDVRVRVDAAHVRIDVADDGIGIPAASLQRVFERFYRVDRSRSREMGGTGLGLAIVKHVVRAHGGQVDVESVEGRGTTFTVMLPRLAETESSIERVITESRI